MKPSTYKRIATTRPAIFGAAVKKLLRIKRRVVETKHGTFYLDPASNLGFQILEDGEYEPEVIRALHTFLSPASVFVDLGANEGFHTVISSKLCSRVIAIEPQERVLPILRRNLELNGCDNVTVVPFAISDRDGESRFYLYPSTNTGPSGLIPTLRYPVPTTTVNTTTLQAIFDAQEIRSCDLIKIDIEGAEYEAITGSPELFKSQHIKAILIEPSDAQAIKHGHRFEDIAAFLRSCGYTPDQRFQCDWYRQVWVS